MPQLATTTGLRSGCGASTSGRPGFALHGTLGRVSSVSSYGRRRRGAPAPCRAEAPAAGVAAAAQSPAPGPPPPVAQLQGAAGGHRGLAAMAEMGMTDMAGLAPKLTKDVMAELPSSEVMRRLKISAANKGKVPWNKGRQHSPEIVAKIRQRTKEAMQRPDVKAKLLLANQHRPGHSPEAKQKIRDKLRAKVEVERAAIVANVERIMEDLRASQDEVERECAAHPKAARIIEGLGWQCYKRLVEYERLHEHWHEPGSHFRQRCLDKIWQHVEHARAVRARPRPGKVKLALELMRKLDDARGKLKQADHMAGAFRRAVPTLAGDPRQAHFLASLHQTELVASKIRAQVEKLEAALEPLVPFLQQAGATQAPKDAAAASSDDGAAGPRAPAGATPQAATHMAAV